MLHILRWSGVGKSPRQHRHKMPQPLCQTKDRWVNWANRLRCSLHSPFQMLIALLRTPPPFRRLARPTVTVILGRLSSLGCRERRPPPALGNILRRTHWTSSSGARLVEIGPKTRLHMRISALLSTALQLSVTLGPTYWTGTRGVKGSDGSWDCFITFIFFNTGQVDCHWACMLFCSSSANLQSECHPVA